MKEFLVILLIFASAFIFSCKQKGEDVSKIISEIEEKEAELKEVGVPKFLREEQKALETNTNQDVVPISPDELWGTRGGEVPGKSSNTNVLVSQGVEHKLEYPFTPESLPPGVRTPAIRKEKPETLDKKIPVTEPKISRGEPRAYHYPSPREVKLYFSYENKKTYVDTYNPGKITAVAYVGGNVWYIDYRVYAIPYRKRSAYRSYMTGKYLIGFGKNISVVDGRSQFTVYWSGRNLGGRLMPNGKYIVVVKMVHKDRNKKRIASRTKILGRGSPVVVILAN